MGCNTSNAEWSTGGKKCTEYDVPSGVWKPNVVTFPVRNTNLNWPDVDRDRVMYPSFIKTGNQPTREACGKEKKVLSTTFSKVVVRKVPSRYISMCLVSYHCIPSMVICGS